MGTSVVTERALSSSAHLARSSVISLAFSSLALASRMPFFRVAFHPLEPGGRLAPGVFPRASVCAPSSSSSPSPSPSFATTLFRNSASSESSDEGRSIQANVGVEFKGVRWS